MRRPERLGLVTGLALVVVLGSALAACPRGDEPAGPSCLPGESRLCHCVDGSAGRQVCEADGRSLGPCECAGDAADAGAPADQPQAQAALAAQLGPPPTEPAPAASLPPAPPAGPAAAALTAPPGADASTVVLLHLDEGQGETAGDSGPYGFRSRVSGGIWTEGRFGKGLLLDGAAASVRLPSLGGRAPTGPLTVEAWLRPESARQMEVFHAHDGLALGLRPDDAGVRATFRLAVGGAPRSLTSGSLLALWQWHHVAGTFDGAAMRIWVDGRLDGELEAAGTLDAAAGCEAPAVGSSCRGDSGWFHGGLDEVRLSAIVRYLPTDPTETVSSTEGGRRPGRGPTKAGGAADAGPTGSLPPAIRDLARDGVRQLNKALGVE